MRSIVLFMEPPNVLQEENSEAINIFLYIATRNSLRGEMMPLLRWEKHTEKHLTY